MMTLLNSLNRSIDRFIAWVLGDKPKPVTRLKEDAFPFDRMGRPDLSYFTDPVEYYAKMHEEYLDSLTRSRGSGVDHDLAYRKGVTAQWGLIAKGQEAIPFALGLLQRNIPEAREDGATILAEIGRNGAVVDAILEALTKETEQSARDSIIGALGRLKSPRAIPALGRIIRYGTFDRDTQLMACDSLGEIVGRRFSKAADPRIAAKEWLEAHHE